MEQTKEKFDIYKSITRDIVMKLSKGEIPWRKRWCSPISDKLNYKSRRKYNGINLLILQQPGEYLTMKQCNEAGGHVRKGEKSHTIYQYFPVPLKGMREEYERRKKAGEDTTDITVPVLRYQQVFHLSQTEGVTSKIETIEHEKAKNPVDMADYVITKFTDNTGIRINETQTDTVRVEAELSQITIPSRKQFKTEEQWYNTLFGAIAGTTLDKMYEDKKMNDAHRELVTEIAACMITTGTGIAIDETEYDTLAECKKWSAVLNNDFRLIVTASSQAQKIAEDVLKPIM